MLDLSTIENPFLLEICKDDVITEIDCLEFSELIARTMNKKVVDLRHKVSTNDKDIVDQYGTSQDLVGETREDAIIKNENNLRIEDIILAEYSKMELDVWQELLKNKCKTEKNFPIYQVRAIKDEVVSKLQMTSGEKKTS